MAGIGDYGFRSDSVNHKGHGKSSLDNGVGCDYKFILYYRHERAWNVVTWGRLAGDPKATAE
jgi:hypothetical protein